MITTRPAIAALSLTLAVVASLAGTASALAHFDLSATNKHDLPIGDGRYKTSGPKRGYIYSCSSSFNSAGGAMVNGPWLHGSTYDLLDKATVDGANSWPQATFSALKEGGERVLSGNGLPVGTTTGTFPISSSDDAYQYDRNPNSIKSRQFSYSIPTDPTKASSASCLPQGVIGYAKNGVAIFNGLDAGGRDAVAHEVQDTCGGHPQQEGEYHYHEIPSCLTKGDSKHKRSSVVGYALDGFPITGPRGPHGKKLADDDLDACHGTKGKIKIDGKKLKTYHYAATDEYPYTLGCFRGTPVGTSTHP